MSDLLSTILRELKQATGATKALVALVAAVVVGMIGVAAVVSNRPDFQPAFSGLSAAEMSAVTRALSEAGIAFEVSQPPQPFLVFVDKGDRADAMAAAYGAGALDKPIGGILADQGAASIFLGNEERQQAVRKREWQETEGMLETLDFVISARVRTSPRDPRQLLGRPSAPTTASVTLQLRHHSQMDDEQADVVAKLVSRGLGVDPMNIVISDQAGTLYDGSGQDKNEQMLDDHLDYKRTYDEETRSRVNDALLSVLGPDKAFVLIDSQWDFDQSVTRTETTAKGQVVSEETVKTEQPLLSNNSGPGGVTGLSSNTAPGEVNTGSGDPSASGGTAQAADPPVSTSEETSKTYMPSRTLSERVQNAPLLTRLSVALFVDESVDDTQLEKLKSLVSSSVGLDSQRNDILTAERLPFLVPEVAEGDGEGADATAAEAPAEPNPLMETLLTRGVEIVSAVVFLLFLMKSLKTAKKASDAASAPPLVTRVAPDGTITEVPADQEPEIDPELLARVQVEKLLESDPDKVGEILSSWARGEDAETGAAA